MNTLFPEQDRPIIKHHHQYWQPIEAWLSLRVLHAVTSSWQTVLMIVNWMKVLSQRHRIIDYLKTLGDYVSS